MHQNLICLFAKNKTCVIEHRQSVEIMNDSQRGNIVAEALRVP